jgi:hypothetical protein
MTNENEHNNSNDNTILGLPTNELAGLSVEEITGNKTAITMIMHYYKQLVDENMALKNNNNTLQTYVNAYQRNKSNSAIGAILLAISNVSVGFGINLITSGNIFPGLATLIPGLMLIIAGIYFTFLIARK